MSLRPAGATPSAPNAAPGGCGSLFGPAINAPADGFWSRLAVSPPRSPPTASLGAHAPTPPEFRLDGGAQGEDVVMTDAAAAVAGDAATTRMRLPALPSVTTTVVAKPTLAARREAHFNAAPEVPVLESVCPTWAYDVGNDTALIVFDQEANQTTMMVRSSPRRVHNRNPVIARPVSADRVVWKAMLDSETGTAGHVFQLCKHGAVACRIEVTLRDGGPGEEEQQQQQQQQQQLALRRVAIVQASYAPLAVASGIADRSSLLVYDEPDAHLDSLRGVHKNLLADAELGYAPVSECCVTAHLDRLSLCMPSDAHRDPTSCGRNPGHHHHHHHHQTARCAWVATKAFLKSMSSLTANCVDRYVETEIERTGTHELRHVYKLWRRALA